MRNAYCVLRKRFSEITHYALRIRRYRPPPNPPIMPPLPVGARLVVDVEALSTIVSINVTGFNKVVILVMEDWKYKYVDGTVQKIETM